MNPEAQAERKRCAAACLDLERRWRQAAERIRKAGTRKSWLFGSYIMPYAERNAAAIEAAANGLKTVRKIIVEGLVPKGGVYCDDYIIDPDQQNSPINLGNYVLTMEKSDGK